MARVAGEITIERPPAVVFDFVADERNEPTFNAAMIRCELTTPPPIGAGSRFAAVLRSGRGEMPLTVEFTDFDRPRRLGSHSEAPTTVMDGELTFVPHGDGTTMRWDWTVRATGALRLLDPLIALWGRRQERRIWRRLKEVLESDGTAGGTGPGGG